MPSRAVASGAAARYLAKAEEFLAAADWASGEQRWNACGLNAVHAGISAVDAFCAAAFSERSAGPNHFLAAEFLESRGGRAVAPQANALRRLLARKTRVEYEDRPITPSEARDALQRATRLVGWARERVPKESS